MDTAGGMPAATTIVRTSDEALTPSGESRRAGPAGVRAGATIASSAAAARTAASPDAGVPGVRTRVGAAPGAEGAAPNGGDTGSVVNSMVCCTFTVRLAGVDGGDADDWEVLTAVVLWLSPDPGTCEPVRTLPPEVESSEASAGTRMSGVLGSAMMRYAVFLGLLGVVPPLPSFRRARLARLTFHVPASIPCSSRPLLPERGDWVCGTRCPTHGAMESAMAELGGPSFASGIVSGDVIAFLRVANESTEKGSRTASRTDEHRR